MGSGRALAAPLPQETPPLVDQSVDDEPFAEILPPVQPDEPGAELIPSLPAAVILELAQPVLVVGDQLRLTIQVNSDFAEEVKAVTLTVILPPGIQTEKGERGELSWPLPSAPKQEPFQQQLLLTVDADAVSAEGAVLALDARLAAPGYLTSDWSTTVGIAADRGRGDAIVEQRQGAQGLVLQDGSGFLTLLADAKAMAATTTVRYSELYRWDNVAPVLDAAATEGVAGEEDAGEEDALVGHNVVTATVALSSTVPMSSTAQRVNQLFLPLVESGAAPLTSAAALTATKPSDLPPTRDENGVQLYYQWQFDAANDQETVKEFAEPLHLSLALAPLVAAGVDPTTLELWSRESSDERWTLVRSDYDANQQRLTAFLPHFTQFGLGAGLSQNGEILPSTIGYTTDRLTGSASLQLPIEAPAGVGGLNPNLSFSYSSMASDDLFLDSNQDYLSQTSGVGMGWGVAGSNNFIVRTGGSLDNNTPDTYKSFSAVLNGMRVNIRYEEGAWRTDPETFYQVYWAGTDQGGANPVVDWGGWTLIAPDGTKYEFGDNGTFAGFSSSSPTAVFMEQTNGNLTYRLAKQWYLRRVTDPLGNKIDYFYKGEQGVEQDCIQSSWPTANRWYTRAVYPTEIQWSGNVSTGLSNKLRVLFTYDSADRKDYKIEDWGEHDCKQVKFAIKDRLLFVTVQADSGGWATLHKYELTQSNYPNDTSTTARLILNSIKILGKNNGILRTESYTYKYGDVVGYGPNRIWLESVDNGWGGKVTYQYISHRPECPTAICGQNTAHGWRAAVTRTIVEDGVGNKLFTDYWYGVPSDPNDEWGRIGVEDGGAQFFGFKETQATYYATALASTSNTAVAPAAVIKWDKQESWPGAQDNPDPRAGKPKKLEVRSSSSGTVVSVTNYNWVAYRRVSGQWQATIKNHETNNNVTTFPIIWVRQESSDTWTAGGAWSGGNFLNGNGSGTQTRTLFDNTSTYRGYGNVLEVQEYSHSETTLDKATWDSRVTGNTSLTQLRRTLTDYFAGTDVRNAPARVRIYNGTTCMSEMRYIYDDVNGNYNVAPTAGILKKTEQANNSCSSTATITQYDPLWNITRLATDSYGNVTTVNRVGEASSGAQNLIVQTTFDNTYHLFPLEQYYNSSTYIETATYYGVNSGITGIANGLGLSDGKAVWGAMQEHCGVNESCTRQSYDEFGRPIRTWQAAVPGSGWGSDSVANVLRSYTAYGSGSWTRNVVVEWRAPRCYGNFVRNVYDGLGQLLQEQRPQQNWTASVDGCNPGTNAAEVDVNYLYDALGRQTKASVLIATTLSYINRAAVWTQGDSETIYDVAGRPARSYAPNEEQTEYGYSGRSTAVFAMGRNSDPNEVVKWQETDGLGNLKRLRTYNKPYDDHGQSWSAQRTALPIRAFAIDRENVYGGAIQFFWNVGKPFIHAGAAYVSIHKVGNFGAGFMVSSQGVLVKSDNLLTESDPAKIQWETLPDGDIGLRTPPGGGPVSDEQSYSVLSDGSFYCVYRTIDGYPVNTYSRDGGHTWSTPQYKRYANGRLMKHPRAANFAWRCQNGNYLYWFHNHGGRFIVEHPDRPTNAYQDRNPVWISGGVEIDSPDGKVIQWSQPEILLYDDDPWIRMSYPDLIEEELTGEGDGSETGGDDAGQARRYFISETQKDRARVHEIDPTLLAGLWGQFAPTQHVATAALLLAMPQPDGPMPQQVELPALPHFTKRSRTRADYGTEDTRAGVTIDLWLQLDTLDAGQLLLDNRTAQGQGFCLQTTARGTVEILLNDGRTESRWDSDPGALQAGQRQHLVCVIDGGPKIVTFIIDGVLCDGGSDRQFGWGRFNPHLRHLNGDKLLRVGQSMAGLRIYGRALRVSEAIGNYRAETPV